MCHFFIIYHVYIYLYSLYPRSPPRQGISREQYICILGLLLDEEYRVTSIYLYSLYPRSPPRHGISHDQYICTPCILGPLLDKEYRVSIFVLPVSQVPS